MAEKKAAEPTKAEVSEPGRLRAAFSVLRGQRVVPLQIHAQWLETQMVFEDILKRLNAQVARQFKANKDALKLQTQLPEAVSTPVEEGDHATRKSALRARFAQSRGLTMLRPESQLHVAPPEETP